MKSVFSMVANDFGSRYTHADSFFKSGTEIFHYTGCNRCIYLVFSYRIQY